MINSPIYNLILYSSATIMQKWKCLKSETAYESPHFRVKKDLVELPDRSTKKWTYWDSLDSAMILAVMADKKLVMIRQYRYMADSEVIEFPSGKNEAGENIEESARREFEEETGYSCTGTLLELGKFYESYGQLNRRIHMFFTKNPSKASQHLDGGEKGFEDIKVEFVDFDKAVHMAIENKIVAMGSALAILLLKEKIDKKEIEID